MTARTPIKPEDIREGDLIRFERAASDEAMEWRQSTGRRSFFGGGTYYLLDRPAPAVDLPTEPTLGWATNANLGGTELRWWHLDDAGARLRATGEAWGWRTTEVTAFTPAVAVPADALEKLQGHVRDASEAPLPIAGWEWEVAVATFLAAVDAANGVSG